MCVCGGGYSVKINATYEAGFQGSDTKYKYSYMMYIVSTQNYLSSFQYIIKHVKYCTH